MNRTGMGFLAAAGTAFLAVGVASALAASGQDPDWPCVQRKVPELSLAQIWTGAELPASASQWAGDKEIAALVAELSARRVPLDEAEDHIRAFARSLPAGEADARLPKLMGGLFDHMNAERSEIISGIQRYARKQKALAADAVLFGSLHRHVAPHIEVIDVDAHINDPAFADALVRAFTRLAARREAQGSRLRAQED